MRRRPIAPLPPATNTRMILSLRRGVVIATNGRSGRGQLRADFCDASSQEAALGLGVRELECAFVLGPRLVGPAQAAQQVGSCRVEVLIAVEVEPVDEGKARSRSCRLRYGDRAVQLHDRRAG